MKRGRFERDALPQEWPDLYAAAPAHAEFAKRDATIEVALDAVTDAQLRELVASSGISAAGWILRCLYVHMYGRYALARMRRARAGLFVGCTGEDPGEHLAWLRAADGRQVLGVSKRLRADLAALATTHGVDVTTLTRGIVTAFLAGHVGAGPEPRKK